MMGKTYEVPQKPWWRSRSVWFSVLTVAASLLLFLNDQATFLALPPNVGKWALFIAGCCQIVLRFGTTQPIDGSTKLTTTCLELVNDDGTARKTG